MDFNNVVGQNYLKNHLKSTIKNGRIAHAQLFIGKEGCGMLPMAIAYAKQILCTTSFNPDITAKKCDQLQHPDLHFSFPVNNTDSIKAKNVTSDLFINDFRRFVTENPYGNLYQWLQFIGIENKQGNISRSEADSIFKKLQLKSYEGGFKVMIVWMAEEMNNEAANKLLKLIEEPAEKTVILLISENEERLLKTITSRCQTLYFPLVSVSKISNYLINNHNVNKTEATIIAQQSEGNINKALRILKQDSDTSLFENWFITWVRTAFKAKGNKAAINALIGWSETIAKTGRETQKQFLSYCLHFFRQALLQNYKTESLVFLNIENQNFSLEKFAPFVHGNNIIQIEKQLNNASYYIERNANAKIILLDLSMNLTRLLHQKEN